MKNRLNFWIVAALVLVGLASCDKTEENIPDNSVEGSYTGTLTNQGLKSATGTIKETTNATADVTLVSEEEIEVHMYGYELDTTFMLNYYEDHDSVMVCLTGEKFEAIYGHMLGAGHMDGGMMGDINNGETEWQHHMEDEHTNGDEHFGGFDMGNHSFGYSLMMEENGVPYYLHFQGTKNE